MRKRHPKVTGGHINISSIYVRGSEIYQVRDKNDWSNVPGNNRKQKVTRINPWTHAYEQAHGYVPMLLKLEDFK